MKEGGRIVLPLALVFPNGPHAKSITFERRGDESISINLVECGFMPLQGAFAAPPPMHIPTGSGNRLVLTGPQALPVEEQTFSQWLATRGEAYPTGVKVIVLEPLLVDFFTWLAVRSPHGIAKLFSHG